MASTNEFWADRMADEIIDRVEKDEFLRDIVEKHGYFIYDEKTPSGEIHVGSARGWVIHDVLAKVLREKGEQARFVLSSDDYDPFDKPIKGKPEWDKYLGVPFRNIPSPVEGYESWADYYFTQSTKRFEEWGIDAELESTGEQYNKGTFNKAIKKVLDNYKEIQKIFEEIYEKPYKKIPFSPICEKCGKIATTLVTEWDPGKELVTYECSSDTVAWADGCGYKGTVSPYNGTGKLPWKVEWAAKWPSKGVIAETAGKDHFTKGGSRTVSIRISAQVLQYPPPWPSTETEEGPGYEFLNIGGRKMSTSKGIGHGFASISDHIPPKILRFLMVSYKPYSVIDFDPERSNDMMLLYDRYDTAERIYFGKEDSSRAQELKRVYELSQIHGVLQEFPPQVSLRQAGIMVQLTDDNNRAIEMLQRDDEVPAELPEEHREYLRERLDAARKWIREFAPEKERFEVQDTIPDDLTEEQRQAATILAERLREREYSNKELFDEFYSICEHLGMKNTQFFKGLYKILLGKTKGPKLATLILAIGQEKVAQVLEKA